MRSPTSPFGGNSAAVCLLDGAADPAWMQAVAAELRQPATAFVWPSGDGFGLRWFVPASELTLCGHGTLAAAHVLWKPDGSRSMRRPAFKRSAGRSRHAATAT